MRKQKTEVKEIEIKNKKKIIISNIKKYIAVFLLKDQNSYSIIAKKRFNPINSNISFRKHTFPIDISNYSFTKGLKIFYLIEINSGIQLLFGNHKDKDIDTQTIDKILNQKIISDLTSNLNESNFKMNLMNIIFGIIFGGFIGYTIAGFVGGS